MPQFDYARFVVEDATDQIKLSDAVLTGTGFPFVRRYQNRSWLSKEILLRDLTSFCDVVSPCNRDRLQSSNGY